MKLYIRAHDLGVQGIDNVVSKLNELGLDGVQLVAYKVLPDVAYTPDGITQQKAQEIAIALRKAGKEIALIGAYFNPVHANPQKVANGVAVFESYLKYAKTLGCDKVGSETGSFNNDKWTYHPSNRTDAALQTVVEIFRGLADYAASCGINIAMEGAYGHVCYDVDRLYKAIQLINRPNIKVIFDLYNYLDITNVSKCYDILDHGLEVFGNQIEIFHIKDFAVVDGKLKQCAVGKGQLDFNRVLRKIHQSNPRAKLVFEGTLGEDVAPAVQFIKQIMETL